MNKEVEKLAIETSGYAPEQLLDYLVKHFGNRIGLASSFGAEDQVLTDMLCRTSSEVLIFTLDTGRLPQETYDVMHKTRQKYGIEIKVLFPDSERVSQMVTRHGPNLFYGSIEHRKLCCQIRKVEPLRKQLAQLDAWICGLRQDQSITRLDIGAVSWDEQFNLIKVCPLVDWTWEQTWDYIREHDVPYNKLHDLDYPSIGCAPCTRPVNNGEDIRSGRWWWENPEHKECGLHLKK
jgi:phosphoadenosine phosphosulfate reductase